ncbi:unnamed protein product, partial [Ceratitis capitata]
MLATGSSPMSGGGGGTFVDNHKSKSNHLPATLTPTAWPYHHTPFAHNGGPLPSAPATSCNALHFVRGRRLHLWWPPTMELYGEM